ncbi:hypothetical protein [Schlesneria sp. DSM 10557]|uniref:hypothetical protein n=1 Tax=Schlesneria sp. DSM 10557 TaxID=3044399 RepID=UPI00359F2E0D
MAHRTDVAPITVSDAVRKLATQSQRSDDPVKAAALELAAALIDASANRNSASKASSSIPDSADTVLSEWAKSCAGLLAAMAGPLSHDPRKSNGTEISAEATSLSVAAERLANQTRLSSESLANLVRELKANSAEIARQAGEVGTLSLASQRERLRLNEDLRKAEFLTAELKSMAAERGPVVERIRLLQERFQLAQGMVEEQRKFEQQVRDADSAATLAEASVKKLSAELQECQKRLEVLQAEHAVLPDRIKMTRDLIEKLKQSPDQKLFEGIQKIWKQLPLDHSNGGS